MQFKASIVALALAATAALAQDLSGLPTCAQAPALASIGNSGCSLTDVACICKNQSFLSGLQTKVAQSCPSPSDQAAAAAFAQKLCAQYGVNLSVTPTAPAATTTPAPVTTTAAAAATTTYAVTTPTTVVLATGTGAPAPSGNGTVVTPPSPSSSVVTGAAPRQSVQAAGMALVMGVVGAVVAL